MRVELLLNRGTSLGHYNFDPIPRAGDNIRIRHLNEGAKPTEKVFNVDYVTFVVTEGFHSAGSSVEVHLSSSEHDVIYYGARKGGSS